MLASLLGLVVLASPSFGVPGASLSRNWPVGLRAMEERGFSRESFFCADGAALTVYSVTSVGDSIVVVHDVTLGDVYARLRIAVSPEGATAWAEESFCTYEWKPANLAGCVALVTDGVASVLDFELYDGEQADPMRRFGRVDLGEVGVELALALARRPAPSAHRNLERQSYRAIRPRNARDPAEAYGPREASGLLDAFGRRQGTWLVRDEGLELPRLEMGWRDGVPDGPFVQREGGRVVASGRLRMGRCEPSPAEPESAPEVEARRRIEGLHTRR